MRLSKILAAVLTAVLADPAGAGTPPEKTMDLHFLEAWEGSAEGLSARMVNTVQYSCLQEARRTYFEGPGGERILFETVFRPAEGLTRTRVQDDRTGWWVELRDRSALRVKVTSPDQYGRILFWQQKASEGPYPLERTLSINGRGVFTGSADTHHRSFEEEIATRLEKSGASEKIVQEMPPGVAQAVLFLESAFEDGVAEGTSLGKLGNLVEILAPVVRRHGEPDWFRTYTGVRWSLRETRGFKGLVAQAPPEGELAFLRGFRSFPETGRLLEGLEAPPGGGCSR